MGFRMIPLLASAACLFTSHALVPNAFPFSMNRFKNSNCLSGSSCLYASSTKRGSNVGGLNGEPDSSPVFEAAASLVPQDDEDDDDDEEVESVEALFGGMTGVQYLEDYDENFAAEEAASNYNYDHNPDIVSAIENNRLIEKSRGVNLIDDTQLTSNLDDSNIYNNKNVVTPPPSAFAAERKTMKICLMPFDRPVFEGSREFLYLYEKKYRTMMDDIENKARIDGEELLGHCYINLDSGCIGKIGTLCQIVEKRRLRNGKSFLIIEAVSRFKITRIVKRSPYLIAEVELDYQDDDVLPEREVCKMHQLSLEVYQLLKMYLRIARLQDCDNQMLTVSPGIRDTKPSPKALSIDAGVGDKDSESSEMSVSSPLSLTGSILRSIQLRNKLFSFECANLLSTESDIMQQLLQSTSTAYRLRGLRCILSEAIGELSYILLEDKLITVEGLNEIEARSQDDDDDDSDLMPPKGYGGISIESELSDITESGMLLEELENEGDIDDDDDDDFIVRSGDGAMEGELGVDGRFLSDTIDNDTGFININIASSDEGDDSAFTDAMTSLGGSIESSVKSSKDVESPERKGSETRADGAAVTWIDDDSIWSADSDQAFQ